MRKKSTKKKKTITPKKTDENVKPSKTPVTNKSTKSGTKKPKIQSTGEEKTMPSLVARGTGKKTKTSKQSKKSLDKDEKVASSKDTVADTKQGNRIAWAFNDFSRW